MNISRKTNIAFNWPLVAVVGALLVVGLFNLYSAVFFWGEEGSTAIFWSQLVWTLAGFCIMFLIAFTDYRRFIKYSLPIYLVICALLFMALIFGQEIRGTRGWLRLGSFSLQPVEFAKLAFILVAARFFSENPNPDGNSLADLWKPLILMLIPFGIILMQGDMGSSLFLILIFVSVAFFAKVKRKTLITCAVIGCVAISGVFVFGLKEYQRNRIFNYINPEADVRGSGYHLVQSKIAVGSGKIFGKGYLKGNINKLRYLPERHTDFIFPVLAEEWGFLGSMLILALYAGLLMMGIETGSKSRDRFGAFVAIGIVALLFWQIAVNLGGVLGLIPLTGVTLPFLSYGGSSMIALLAAMGFLLSIYRRRFMF